MDENGAGVLAQGVRNAGFKSKFTKADFPAIRTDLDDFLALFAERYGKILAKACNQGGHPPLILPLYQGPDIVYKALAPYVDGFWFSSHNLREDALRIYNAGHKPVIAADYIDGHPRLALILQGQDREDQLRRQRRLSSTRPAVRYNFRSIGFFLCFPDSPDLQKAGVIQGRHPLPPRIRDSLEHVRVRLATILPTSRWRYIAFTEATAGLERRPMPATQEERAKRMIEAYDSVLNLKGDDGNCFVLGLEHWCLNDDGVNNWSETDNFGIATLQDNAYDGIEAKKAAGKDSRGYTGRRRGGRLRQPAWPAWASTFVRSPGRSRNRSRAL